jgi:N-acyl-D-aspartate/D-glutamate deacylase
LRQLKDGNRFDALPAWKNLMALPLDARLAQLRDGAVRSRLAGEIDDRKLPINFSRNWDLVFVNKTSRAENQLYQGKSVAEVARLLGKSNIDALFELALSEDLETVFEDSTTQGDENAVREIFRSPFVLLGQSDAGAHVANGNPGFGYATFLLSYWVRQRGIMTLEEAIKKLTFMPASVFGIHDRGLLRPGMKADVFVFDPSTIDLAKPQRVNDLPEGAPRFVQGAKGVHYTIVNGTLLMNDGHHTGKFPGKVLRSC